MNRISSWANVRWVRMLSALFGLIVPALWLWTLISPSEEVTRIRSALLYEMGAPKDFIWTPDKIPSTFLVDTGPATPEFEKTANEILEHTPMTRGEFEVGLAIARSFASSPTKIDGPIRSDLLTTYDAIKNQGRGYCADYTKVFNAIANAAHLPVRQWGFAFDAFGSGHTFNEVYDRTRAKWLLVDSFHLIYFIDADSREPLSALEVHDRLLGLASAPHEIAMQAIVPGQTAFRSDAVALDYYRRGMPQLYLVWGTNVFDYERALTFKMTAGLSRTFEALLAITTGRYPRMVVYPKGVSERDVEELKLHRVRLLLAGFACALGAMLFLIQILSLLQSRKPAAQ